MRRTGAMTPSASQDVRAVRRLNDGVFGALAGVVVAAILREWLTSSVAKTPSPTPTAPPPALRQPSQDRAPRSLRGHAGTKPDGPDEGFYDPRRGATGYSPVVATFGALAVPALVVLFTNLNDIPADRLVLSSGLPVVGIIGSLIGAFGLAAVGTERDGTANLGAVIMFIGVPVAVSMFSVLGAFEVLADVFVPNATKAFLFMEGLGVVFGVYLIAVAVGDAPTLHPRTLTPDEFDQWRAKQWLQNRRMSYEAANKLFVLGLFAHRGNDRPPVGTEHRPQQCPHQLVDLRWHLHLLHCGHRQWPAQQASGDRQRADQPAALRGVVERPHPLRHLRAHDLAGQVVDTLAGLNRTRALIPPGRRDQGAPRPS